MIERVQLYMRKYQAELLCIFKPKLTAKLKNFTKFILNYSILQYITRDNFYALNHYVKIEQDNSSCISLFTVNFGKNILQKISCLLDFI